jgi:hypothetical protein
MLVEMANAILTLYHVQLGHIIDIHNKTPKLDDVISMRFHRLDAAILHEEQRLHVHDKQFIHEGPQ